jgi:hypothetical protein
VRYQDALVYLTPTQDLRIRRAQREVVKVADAGGVDRFHAARVVPQHVSPQRAAQVLVNEV